MTAVRKNLPLIAILLLAAATRLLACALWWQDLSRDPDAYLGLAERLVAGQGFVAPDGRPTAYRPPLYPMLLTSVLWAGSAGIALLQITLGVATTGLTARFGRRLGLGRWSLLAAGSVAVDPLLLRYTPHVMTEVTCAFLAVLMLDLGARVQRPAWLYLKEEGVHLGPATLFDFARGQRHEVLSQQAREPRDIPSPLTPLPRGEGDETGSGRKRLKAGNKWKQWLAPILLGAVFGLTALARPTFWVFGAFAVVAWAFGLLFSIRREFSNGDCGAGVSPALRAEGSSFPALASRVQARHLHHKVVEGLAVAITAAIVVSPWVLRNSLVLGSPVLTTTHGGYTLLLANNPVFWDEVVDDPAATAWQGESLDAWQRSLEIQMNAEGIGPGDELARDRWMRDRAMRHIRENPERFFKATLLRLRRLFDIAPTGGESGAVSELIVVATGVYYTAVSLLAFAGVVSVLLGGIFAIRTCLLVRPQNPPLSLGRGAGGEGDRLMSDRRLRSSFGDGDAVQDKAMRRDIPSPLSPFPRERGKGFISGFTVPSLSIPLRAWLPALLLIAAFCAVHAVYWTDARMRAPLIPAIALFAALGAQLAKQWLHRRSLTVETRVSQ